MSDFTPPFPKPLAVKPSRLRVLRQGRSCPLHVLTERMYRMKMGESRIIRKMKYMLVEPSLVKRVLNDIEGVYPKSSIIWRSLFPIIGNSIFVSNGETWRRQRKLLEPAFGITRISAAFARMADAVADMRGRLERLPSGDVWSVEGEMTHVTADVIFRTICSVSMSQAEALETYNAFVDYQRIAYGEMSFDYAGWPALLSPTWWRARRAAKRVRAVMDPMVRARFEKHAAGARDEHDDILAALLNASDPETGKALKFGYDELVEQIAVLFLAGHETSAAALSWALWLIAAQPEIQERLHLEVVALLGDRQPTFADMKRLPLTRDVFREALRLYPSVPFLARDATREEVMRGKKVKPGSVLVLSPWLSQRNEKLWEKPHVFDPDRFERPEAQESLRNAYFPFSAGPRVCLGAAFALQEATLVLAEIVRRFRLEAIAGDTPMPLARLTLRSVDGIRVRLHHR